MRTLFAFAIFLLSSCGMIRTPDGCEPSSEDFRDWVAAEQDRSEDAYQAYLSKHPNGCFASRANSRLRSQVSSERLPRDSDTASANNPVSAY